MTIPAEKRCPKCGVTKAADGFYRRYAGTMLSSYCKPCANASAKVSERKSPRYKGTGRKGGWIGNRKTRLERFNERYAIDGKTGCWNWTGNLDKDGYGKSEWKPHYRAHRFSYATFVGEIPAGLCVCHECDNRKCVNPKHLFLGTNAENIADRDAKRRNARGPKLRPDHIPMKSALAAYADMRSGATQKHVAEKYGFSRAAASLISRRLTWHFRDEFRQAA